jgi:hypothetical protein
MPSMKEKSSLWRSNRLGLIGVSNIEQVGLIGVSNIEGEEQLVALEQTRGLKDTNRLGD